jgi:nitrate reductase NapAB chaperone NapD
VRCLLVLEEIEGRLIIVIGRLESLEGRLKDSIGRLEGLEGRLKVAIVIFNHHWRAKVVSSKAHSCVFFYKFPCAIN